MIKLFKEIQEGERCDSAIIGYKKIRERNGLRLRISLSIPRVFAIIFTHIEFEVVDNEIMKTCLNKRREIKFYFLLKDTIKYLRARNRMIYTTQDKKLYRHARAEKAQAWFDLLIIFLSYFYIPFYAYQRSLWVALYIIVLPIALHSLSKRHAFLFIKIKYFEPPKMDIKVSNSKEEEVW